MKHSRPSWEWGDGLVLADANGDALIVEAADWLVADLPADAGDTAMIGRLSFFYQKKCDQ